MWDIQSSWSSLNCLFVTGLHLLNSRRLVQWTQLYSTMEWFLVAGLSSKIKPLLWITKNFCFVLKTLLIANMQEKVSFKNPTLMQSNTPMAYLTHKPHKPVYPCMCLAAFTLLIIGSVEIVQVTKSTIPPRIELRTRKQCHKEDWEGKCQKFAHCKTPCLRNEAPMQACD